MSYAHEIEAALKDGFLRRTLDKFAVEYRAGRDRVFAEVDERALIQRIADVKDDAARHMEELYEKFRAEAEKRGAVVHRAKDAAEAREIIAAIAQENGVHKIVKSKSMTAEEIGLNAHLEAAGIEVNETDLGEWIVQLRHERPSHMVMPAIHLSRGQVADEFEKATGRAQDHEDVQKLVKTARAELRPKFHAADMGISGANFLIAETGSLAIVTNEGNGRLVNTLPRVHVALAGLDKLIPTLDDALTALQVLPRNATGQRLTSYVTFIDGATANPPHRAARQRPRRTRARSALLADLPLRAVRRVRERVPRVPPRGRTPHGTRLRGRDRPRAHLPLPRPRRREEALPELRGVRGVQGCLLGRHRPAATHPGNPCALREGGRRADGLASCALRDAQAHHVPPSAQVHALRAEALCGQGRLRAPPPDGALRQAGVQVPADPRQEILPRALGKAWFVARGS